MNTTNEAVALPAAARQPDRQIGFWLLLGASVVAVPYVEPLWLKALVLAVVVHGTLRILHELSVLGFSTWSARRRWRYEFASDVGPALLVPNEKIRDEDVRRLLNHPDMGSKRAHGLRQLIYWWQVPATECHQEIMEHGDIYVQLRPVTVRMLAQPAEDAERLLQRCIREALQKQAEVFDDWSVTHLRAIVGPMVMPFCYEYALGRRCPAELVPDLLAISANLIASVGGVTSRDLSARLRVLEHLRGMLQKDGGRPDLFGQASQLSIDQRAQYLQGVWMQTAAAQLLRLSCNALCLLAKNPRCLSEVLAERVDPGPYTEAVLAETLRIAPGTALTNRVAGRDIDVNGITIERGTNVLFAFKSHHRMGFERSDEFIPERWRSVVRQEANFVPFGAGKRRCPAERLSFQVASAIVHGVLSGLEIRVPADRPPLFPQAGQFRVNDLCCVIRRSPPGALMRWWLDCRLRAALAVSDLRRSILPLFLMPRMARAAFAEFPIQASDKKEAT